MATNTYHQRADIADRLYGQGAELEGARRTQRDAMLKITVLAPQALAAGMTKTEICKLAQISRPTLDEMLKRDERRR